MLLNYNHNIIRERIEKALELIKIKILAVEQIIEQKLAGVFNYTDLKPFYEELNFLTNKKKRILYVLENNLYGFRKKIRPRYEIVLLHEVKNHIVNLNNSVLCGKTAVSNDQVFNKTKELNWTYYHANVIGGGLIAMMEESDGYGNALACLYSKYLKINGSPQGTSSKTRSIRKGSKKGSFIFLEKKTVTVYEDLKMVFYVDSQKRKIYVGFDAFLDAKIKDLLKQLKRDTFLICPRRKTDSCKYFFVNEVYSSVKIVNLNILDVLIPDMYTLRFV